MRTPGDHMADGAAATRHRTRSWWGWGWTDQALATDECRSLGALIPGLASNPRALPHAGDLRLRAPRITPPASLAERCSSDLRDRAAHAYGKAYRDVVRALRLQVDNPPDLVCRPRDEQDVVDLLDWAGTTGTAVIPYGGGSSVVGGVEYRGEEHAAVVSLDLTTMGRVLDVDEVSCSARIQAGAFGPSLEEQLRRHGLTLRHFPQSFEFSTLGGWLATRSAGHFATGLTHVDDLTESIRAVTPSGVIESWRLPGSAAGPSPDRLLLGSEGTLGVITEAWMRVRRRPTHRASASVRFTGFDQGLDAIREIAQSGLQPANCRLLDPGEARLSGVSSGTESVLVLGFESPSVEVDQGLNAALEMSAAHGGRADPSPPGGRAGGAAVAWREAFLRMPYVRDGLARMGAICETFETAVTWERVPDLCTDVRDVLSHEIENLCGSPGLINCRVTHVYADGAAPYFTVLVAGQAGAELEMWDALKVAASEILQRHGATITHHHAVGRDHRPWYDRQRPDLFASALRAAKRELDPRWILNPGVLIDP